MEALAAVLGGTNSLHTNARDEVLALPSAKAAEIALRTQQVIMEETGAANVADPLGGSWYVEALTDEMERQAEEIFDRVKEMAPAEHPIGMMTGGILRGIEDGWFSAEIAESAFRYQTALEKGDKKIVGVNSHNDHLGGDLETLRIGSEVEHEQRRVLSQRRGARDDETVGRALDQLVAAAQHAGQPRPCHARCDPGRGHPRRGVRRAAHAVGLLLRAPAVLTRRARRGYSAPSRRIGARPVDGGMWPPHRFDGRR